MAKRTAKRGRINNREMASVSAVFAAIAWAIEYNFRSTEIDRASGRATVPARAIMYGGLGLISGVFASKYSPSLGAGLMLGGALAAGSVAVVSPETTNPSRELEQGPQTTQGSQSSANP